MRVDFRLRVHVSVGPWWQRPFFKLFQNGGRAALGPVFILWSRPIPGNPRFEFCLNAPWGLEAEFRLR